MGHLLANVGARMTRVLHLGEAGLSDRPDLIGLALEADEVAVRPPQPVDVGTRGAAVGSRPDRYPSMWSNDRFSIIKTMMWSVWNSRSRASTDSICQP